ncbi:hypothetical protein [Kitasatospora brasiliensis]|uniref:hypothetical protein n=1 Tax=Kitasatospora brasiliensis TaxID=3058040 RepID=UPI00292E5973|nr:hypothetical protein [Kitasatospora sp. K002]
MTATVHVESLGDHEYLVRVRKGAEEATTRLQAGEGALDQLDLPGADEVRVVQETMAFLAERQPVIDIPPMIDLDDLAAAYGDLYIEDLRRRLNLL